MSRALLVLSFPAAFAGIWSGDQRWLATAAVILVGAVCAALLNGARGG